MSHLVAQCQPFNCQQFNISPVATLQLAKVTLSTTLFTQKGIMGEKVFSVDSTHQSAWQQCSNDYGHTSHPGSPSNLEEVRAQHGYIVMLW